MQPWPRLKSKLKPKTAVGEPLHSFTFTAIGTDWWVGIYQSVAAPQLAQLRARIEARVADFDQMYSRFRPDSLVSQIATSAGSYAFPPDSEALFEFYQQLYNLTDHAVTPLVGQLLADAGYDATYSLRSGILQPVPEWSDVMQFDGNVLTTTRPLLLDFGAAGKGYLVDIVSELLQAAGLSAYCVDASGDLRYRHSSLPLRIGLENPDDPTQIIGVAALLNQSLCASATNRRSWGNYHHIMDPRSLRPVEHVQAVWTIAASTMLADGLATALFFTEAARLRSSFDFSYVKLYVDKTVESSIEFPGELF